MPSFRRVMAKTNFSIRNDYQKGNFSIEKHSVFSDFSKKRKSSKAQNLAASLFQSPTAKDLLKGSDHCDDVPGVQNVFFIVVYGHLEYFFLLDGHRNVFVIEV